MLKRELSCPYCHSTMRVDYYKDIEIDICDKCRDIWFDKGELDKFLAYEKRDRVIFKEVIHNSPVKSKAQCPSCNEKSLNITECKSFKFGYCPSCDGILIRKSFVNKISPKINSTKISIPKDAVEIVSGEVAAGFFEVLLGLIFDG